MITGNYFSKICSVKKGKTSFPMKYHFILTLDSNFYIFLKYPIQNKM